MLSTLIGFVFGFISHETTRLRASVPAPRNIYIDIGLHGESQSMWYFLNGDIDIDADAVQYDQYESLHGRGMEGEWELIGVELVGEGEDGHMEDLITQQKTILALDNIRKYSLYPKYIDIASLFEQHKITKNDFVVMKLDMGAEAATESMMAELIGKNVLLWNVDELYIHTTSAL